ncbi:MAG: hypothetical protein ACI9S8_000805 [Chlamydiales bacterium]|jgi:hypothetical protein
MKVRIYVFIALLALILTGCSLFKRGYPEMAHAITLRTAKQFADEKGMSLVGTGGGMIDQVNRLSMYLYHSPPLKVSEARKLALYVVDRYLENVNSDEKIRPFLNNHPFLVQDLTVYISFRYPNGSEVSPGELAQVTISEGMFIYKTLKKFTAANGEKLLIPEKMFKETIDEARELVK